MGRGFHEHEGGKCRVGANSLVDAVPMLAYTKADGAGKPSQYRLLLHAVFVLREHMLGLECWLLMR
jgi:hypothetical protein